LGAFATLALTLGSVWHRRGPPTELAWRSAKRSARGVPLRKPAPTSAAVLVAGTKTSRSAPWLPDREVRDGGGWSLVLLLAGQLGPDKGTVHRAVFVPRGLILVCGRHLQFVGGRRSSGGHVRAHGLFGGSRRRRGGHGGLGFGNRHRRLVSDLL